MSVHVSSQVWAHSKAGGNALLLLVWLADKAHDDGLSWHSVAKMATACRMSERSVQRNLAELEALGEIRREFREGRSTRIWVTVSDPRQVDAPPTGDKLSPPTPASPPPDASVTPPLTPASPINVRETSRTVRPPHPRTRGRPTGGAPSVFAGKESGYIPWS